MGCAGGLANQLHGCLDVLQVPGCTPEVAGGGAPAGRKLLRVLLP